MCITCGYVHYTVEDQTKLRYQLWLDQLRLESGRKVLRGPFLAPKNKRGAS